MAAGLRFGRFDLQVRFVLLLLVLFLGLIAILNQVLLGRARTTLERTEREQVEIASRDIARRIADRVAENGYVPPQTLRREAAREGFEVVRVLDGTGRPLSSSPGSTVGVPSVFEGFDRDRRAALTAGRAVTMRVPRSPEGTSIVAFHPILGPDGGVRGIVEAAVGAPELDGLDTGIRTLRTVQVIGVFVVAGIAILFANWVSRPYRKLAVVATEAGLESDAGADPGDLADAFRGMVARLREQDEALGSVEGGGLGDLVRFAARSASEMTTGVLVVDRRMRVAAMNEASARLLGLDREKARGAGLDAVPAAGPALYRRVATCLNEGTASTREVVSVRRPDGVAGHLGVSVTPSIGADGESAGALVLMTDLTEIRDLQEQARVRDNLAAVGQVAAGIAHEFRNALGTILANARIAERRGNPEAVDAAREIVNEVETVRKTVDQFLQYARPPAAEITEVDLRGVIEGCASAAPDRVEIRIEGEFGTVRADEGLLRRVFDNLFRNARDAAGSAARRVHVRVGGRPVADDRIIQVEVEDDGLGIPVGIREDVFTPFFTTRARGTGLGLALVQRTLADLGGSVVATAGTEGGALFRLRFPAAG